PRAGGVALEKQQVRLRGVGPELGGRAWEAQDRLRIGRLETLEVVLRDASVSRQHAEVVWGGHGWVVRDLGSSNGAFVNGARVSGDWTLRARDILRCGSAQFLLEFARGDAGGGEETPGYHVHVQRAVRQPRDKALARGAAVAGDRLPLLLEIG